MKDRKSEMQTRIEYEMRYIDHCNLNNKKVDWDRVKTGFMNAFGAGIINGDCGNHSIFELKDMKIEDKHFRILLEAMTTKTHGRNGKPEHITLKFPDNNLTNTSLEALAQALLNANFPHHVSIDLSRSTGFSDAGVKKLIESLSDETCNHTVDIKLPKNPRMVNADLMKELSIKLSDNQQRYQNEPQKKHKKVTKDGLFKSKATSDKIKKAKNEKSPRKSLFTRKAKDNKPKENERKRYTRHHSE